MPGADSGVVTAADRLISVGVPLGVEHDPRPGSGPAESTIRFGTTFFQLDNEAILLWTQGLRAPTVGELRSEAAEAGIAGDPVADLLESRLLRRVDESCRDLALIPLGVAIGNTPQTPAVYEIQIGRGRPIGVDSLVFAAWSGSYGGRSLRTACQAAAEANGMSTDTVVLHVLGQCGEFLGLIFLFDAARGEGS